MAPRDCCECRASNAVGFRLSFELVALPLSLSWMLKANFDLGYLCLLYSWNQLQMFQLTGSDLHCRQRLVVKRSFVACLTAIVLCLFAAFHLWVATGGEWSPLTSPDAGVPLVGCPGENALASAKTISYLSAGNLRENSNYNQNDLTPRIESLSIELIFGRLVCSKLVAI